MINITEFNRRHIDSAITLWQQSEFIGMNAYDDEPKRLQRFLLRNEGCSFVAVENDVVLGTCLCGHDLRRATVYHLAVNSKYRGNGLGMGLLDASLKSVSALGIAKCHAHVLVDNPNAETFWQPNDWILRNDVLTHSKHLR